MEATGALRVAIVAPPYYRVPPDGYGGTERVCAYLADGLVARGHDVTLVAVGGSVTNGRLVTSFDEPQPEGSRDDASIEVVHAAVAARALESTAFDVVHDHTRAGPLTAGGRPAPTLVTIHSPVDAADVNLAAWEALGHWVHYVAVSDSQRAAAPQLRWTATVHNGIPLDRHPFRAAEEKEGFALVLGRLSEDKGVRLARPTRPSSQPAWRRR